MKLQLENPIDSYLFINKIYNIQIYITDHDNSTIFQTIATTLKFSCKLYYHEDYKQRNPIEINDILEFNNTSCQGAGIYNISLSFKEQCSQRKTLLIEFIPYLDNPSTDNSVLDSLQKVVSTVFSLMTYQLHIEEENNAPYIWYKDEGSKDKSIDYIVTLRDINANIVKNQKVFIKVQLLYENGEMVGIQQILDILPSSKTQIDCSNPAIIKFRINEVSNRHRGQLFQVEVSIDKFQPPNLLFEVAPALSVPVDVKSKRNNQRGRSDKAFHNFIRQTEADLLVSSLQNFASGGVNNDSNVSRIPMNVSDPILNPFINRVNSSTLLSNNNTQETINGVEFPVNATQAVNNISLWTSHVLKTMESIKWEIIGYHRSADGSAILTKPLYNIVNPSEAIESISYQYSSLVVNSLRYLQTIPTDNSSVSAHSQDPPDLLRLSSLLDGFPTRSISFGSHTYDTSLPQEKLNRYNSLFLERETSLKRLRTEENLNKIISPEEILVFYIIANSKFARFVSENALSLYSTNIALPALDSSKKLIGFYFESNLGSYQEATKIQFVELGILKNEINLSPLEDLLLEEFSKSDNSDILDLFNHSNKSQLLCENALIHLYKFHQD